jgi:HlyD family secretion protein
MKLTRARISGAVLGTTILAAIVFALRPKPATVDTAMAVRRALESTIDADGRTRVRDRYVVAAPVAGRLERIARVEGSQVNAGEVIARITPLPLDSLEVRQAQARVDAAEALALEAAAQVRAATATLEQRRREVPRTKRLAEAGAVAPRAVEEAELAQVAAVEALRAATLRVHAAEADVRQARTVLADRRGGSGTTVLVHAPARGRILRVPERSERIVAAGAPLLELGDPASLEVVVDVLSSDGALIHPGDRVRLAEWAGGDGAEDFNGLGGRVREIEPSAFTKLSALGVEEQRVNVIIDLDRVPRVLGDGFRVDASIVVWSAPDVLQVPRSALVRVEGRRNESGWSTFVVKAGRVEERSVRVGHMGGAAVEVLAGLVAGEEVVLFPSDQLKPGTRVTARRGA